jgi:tetratricopeptide (TPR) repeat protein
VALRPDYAQSYYTLGTALARYDDLKAAREAFEKALVLEPDFVDAHVGLGLILAQQQDLDSAKDHFELALKGQGSAPSAARTHYLLAKVFTSQHQYTQARRELEAAIKLRPKYAQAYLALGSVCKDLHDETSARAAFERAEHLSPDDPETQYQLGSALLRDNQAGAAVSHLQKAVELRPGDRPTLSQLCRALFRAGPKEEAEGCEQKMAEIAKAGAAADSRMLAAAETNNQGVELESRGDLLGALQKYRAAVDLYPYRIEFARNLGLVFCRLGQWEEGVTQLGKVLKQHPGDVEATRALYIALDHVRKTKGANPTAEEKILKPN